LKSVEKVKKIKNHKNTVNFIDTNIIKYSNTIY